MTLLSVWLPALDGVVAQLERGAKVADVGCGSGESTILIAQAFPRARLYGYDHRPELIELARRHAAEAGLTDRVAFDVASAPELPGREYELVCQLSDLDDLFGAALRVKAVLAPEGTWMLVEARTRRDVRQIVSVAGFTRVRRAVETPLQVVLEARL